jgi:hypothetical protein
MRVHRCSPGQRGYNGIWKEGSDHQLSKEPLLFRESIYELNDKCFNQGGR